jgi:peptidoglycan/LPS O-acetylase OafA/YrhL
MNRQFTALSGLAIAAVVINHSINLGMAIPPEFGYQQSDGWGYIILITLGVFAVPTFLFVSGSFFAYAAQPKLPYNVIWTNLKRLFFPYFLWSVIFYILIDVGQGITFTIWGYLKNLIVGYPFWFVPLLAFYYIISPILVIGCKRFRWLVIAAIGLYQLVLINVLNPGVLGGWFPEWARFLAPPVLKNSLALWGIYFPLGLIYGLDARSIKPLTEKFKWWLVALTLFLFVCIIMNIKSIFSFPLAIYICPIPFVILMTTIKRNSIPFVRTFEKLGKRSFGLYLASWAVIYFAILCIRALVPWLFNYQILFYSFLMILGFLVPLGLMNILEQFPIQFIYHYVFN